MLNFNSILVFSENPDKLSEFYKKVFDMEPGWNEGGYTGFQVGAAFFTIGPHDKVHGKNSNPERIMINLETKNVKKEFDRIEKVTGVKVIKEPYQMEGMDGWIATFADPDGNFFQLVSPFEDMADTKN